MYSMNLRLSSREVAPAELHGGGRFVLSRKDFVPTYVKAFEDGRLQERAKQAVESLKSCRVCPRNCHVDRVDNKIGVCKSGWHARIASAFPHFGEEDCLRGWKGSGTIFFSWCNLRCVFCQNFETSQVGEGTEVTARELADIMLDLQAAGCHNINFVTPEHVVSQIIEALALAVERGLRLPLVYNTSAYDSLESIQLMDGLVDIYMPDFKLWRAEHCANYLGARDYADAARTAIAAMRGVLVRHLVMPSLLDDTREIMGWLAAECSRDTYINVMDQYRPAYKAETELRFAAINRRIQEAEFDQAIEHARAAGLWRLDRRRCW
jgi:putative pyruvate formate lyase activating enzyme